jgi:sodium-independent sulfate anion transporter 11
MSLSDFIASMLAFWLTIFQTAEIGIGAGVGFSILWTLLRSAFVTPRVKLSADDNADTLPPPVTSGGTLGGDNADINVPSDVVVVGFKDSIFFPNAHRGKRTTIEAIKLVYEKIPDRFITGQRERSWSVADEIRIERLRKERNINLRDTPLSVVIFDFTMVSFIDTTGVLALAELKEDIRLYAGKEVQFRLVGLNDSVRERFARGKWRLTELDGFREDGVDVVYPSLGRAVADRERLGSVLEAVLTEKGD